MFITAVLNTKGGCGKTTLATHLAARFARQGHRSILADLDRQQNALRWLARRPASLPLVEGIELDVDEMVLPFGEGRMVIDAPGGLRRKALEVVVRAADVVLVPVLPSRFDEDGSERFNRLLAEMKPVRKGRRQVIWVANRLRARSQAARALDTFCAQLDLALAAHLSEAQHYLAAADTGVTLFDLPPSRQAKLRGEWAPLLARLDELAQAHVGDLGER
jgi:chromosome partitioning protein